jgi:hypothetical protein
MLARCWILYQQRLHLERLKIKQRHLLKRRTIASSMLELAISHGVDVRTTDIWPKYQAIIDELWIVNNAIKAVESCLI